MVGKTLQVVSGEEKTFSNIFALGDVAETGGPKMGRAGAFQAEIVCQNIMSLIPDREPAARYLPNDAEGAIKTLGRGEHCIYLQMANGREQLLPKSGGSDELHVCRFWSEFVVDMVTDSEL